MSEYINYYICKQNKNTKLIYPLGPFDDKGEFKCVIWKSRSFYTDLVDLFVPIPKELLTNELTKKLYKLSLKEYFDGKDDIFDENDYYKMHYCQLDRLASTNFIRSGYFLIDDIKQYEKTQEDGYEFDGFYECLSPQLYCELLKSENTSKLKRKAKKDIEGNEFDIYYASDYAFYMYPDYHSKEYEAFILNEVADILMPSYERDVYDVVVVFTRG